MRPIEAKELRDRWKAKGNPPCDHPRTSKEIMGFSKTGDLVCTTCGYTHHPSKFPSRYQA